MATVLDVFVKLSAGDYAKGAGQVDDANKRMAGSGAGVEKALGRIQAAIGAVALGAMAKQAAGVAVAFDDSLTRINTLVGVARDQVTAWREDLLALGAEAGRAPRELADALYYVTSSGAEGAEALEIVESSARAAAVGLGQTGDVARLTTAALQAYRDDGLTAAAATDILVAAVREGSAEADAMSRSLGTTIAFADSVGVSFAESAAYVATYTRLGVSAEVATTGLNSALRALVTSTPEQYKALYKIGLTLSDLKRMIDERGLAQGLLELRKILRETLGEEAGLLALKDIIPDIQGFQSVLAVTGGLAEDYLGIQERIVASAGDLGRAFEGIQDSPGQAMRELAAQAEALQIAFGDELARSLAAAIQGLGGVEEAGRLAAELGELLGRALTHVVQALDLVAEHGELVERLLIALVAVKVAAWAKEAAIGLRALGAAAAANPLVLILAGLAVAVHEVDGEIEAWSRKASAEIGQLTADANRFGRALREIPALAEAALKSADAAKIKAQWLDFLGKLTEAQAKLRQATALAEAAPGDQSAKSRVTELRLEIGALERGMASLEAGASGAAGGLRLGAEGMAALAGASAGAKPKLDGAGKGMRDAGAASRELKDRLKDLKAELELRREALEAQALARSIGAELTPAIAAAIQPSEVLREALSRGLATLTDPATGLPAVPPEIATVIESLLSWQKAEEDLADLQKDAREQNLSGISEAARLRQEEAAELQRLLDDLEDRTSAAVDDYDFAAPVIADGNENLQEAADLWIAIGVNAANALADINREAGNALGAIINLVAAQRELNDAERSGNAERIAAARRAVGSSRADVAASAIELGASYASGGGTSRFGGRMSGNMAQEGAQVGTAIYPGWGTLIGAVVGFFTKTGADDAHVVLRGYMDGVRGVVTQAEGELGSVASAIAQTLTSFFEDVQSALGISVGDAARDFSIHVRENTVTAVLGGMRREFGNIDEALAWGISQILAQADLAGVAGEATRSLLSGTLSNVRGGFSVEQIGEALNLAAAIDDATSGAGPLAQAIRDISVQRGKEVEIARLFHLSIRDTIALTDRRLAQMMEEVELQRRSLLGVNDYLTATREWVQATKDAAAGIEAERQARLRQAEEIEAELARNANAGDVVNQTVNTLDDALGDVADGLNTLGGEATEAGANLASSLGDVVAIGVRVDDVVNQTTEELGSLLDSIGDLPEALDPQRIVEMWQVAGGRAVLDIIELMRQVRGENYGIEQERRIQAQLLTLQLIASRAALLELIAASEGLFNLSQRFLDDIDETINDLLEGGARPGRRGGGGAGSARREAAEAFRQEAADRAALLAGGTESQVSYAAAVRQVTEQAEAGRISAEELAAAIGSIAALDLRDIAAPFRELALQAGEVDLETTLRQARERLETALADALARAADNPAAYADAVAAIQAGYAAEVEAVVNDALVGLGDSALGLQLQTQETTGTIAYLLANLDLLGLTAEQVANAVRQGTLPALYDLIRTQAERVGDEETLAQLEEDRAEMELAFARIQFEAMVAILEAAGAIDDELRVQIEEWRRLFELPDAEGGGTIDKPKPGPPGADELDAALRMLDPAMHQLADRGDALRGAVNAARLALRFGTLSAEEFAATMGRAAAQIELDFGGRLLAFLDQYYEGSAIGEQMRIRLQELAFAAEMMHLEAEYQMLLALGAVSAETLEQWRIALDYIAENPPTFDLPPGGGFGGGGGVDAAQELRDALAEAREALADFVKGLRGDVADPVAAAILELEGRFAELREALLAAGGSASELAEAEALVAERRQQILREAAESLLELQRELLYGPASLATPEQSIAAGLAEVMALAERVRAGELSQSDAFSEQALELLAQVEAAYGRGAQYDELRALLLAQTADLREGFGAGVGSGRPLVVDDSRQLAALDLQLVATRDADAARAFEAQVASMERQQLRIELVALRGQVALLGAGQAGAWA